MNKPNLPQHPCANKCTNFKDEQCAQCLIEQLDKREFELGLAPDDAYVKTAEDFIAGDVVVLNSSIFPKFNLTYVVKRHLKTAGVVVVYLHGEETRCFHERDIRHATVAEHHAKHRLTATEQSLGEVS